MEGYILSDIGKRLIPPYVDLRKPRYLTVEENERLLKYAKHNKRDFAIIQLLLQTGIKLSELVGLRLQDLHINNLGAKGSVKAEYLWVSGKRKEKGRAIPLNKDVCYVIFEYLHNRVISENDNLFLNKSGLQLGKRGVEKVIEKYMKLAQIKNVSVNSLRHTFGTQQSANGMNMGQIKKLMGIKDMRSLSIYIQ
jgi:site-specific recombinase XerD